ncbi:MAG: TetR family transcriptional regulator [Actinomycetia bacterium]|nr:TetR family transcriptional regulator [Actinomycetes bacterium]
MTARRIGTETSKTRAALLDAAERLMVDGGYAAVTSRRVAAEAGVKPALVHYYFRTMDDLFLALYRRGAQRGLERQEMVLQSPQPLWALWDFSREPYGTNLTMEFVALANHRKEIRAEITASAERFRSRQVEALSGILAGYDLDSDDWPPVVIAVLMSSVARFLVIEAETLEMSTGHDDTVAVVERLLRRLEGDRAPTA